MPTMKTGFSNSAMFEAVLRYLRYTPGAAVGETIRQRVELALAEVEDLSNFKYIYAHYKEPMEFMKQTEYQEYLSGAEGYLLCATTLGVQVDRRIKRLQMSDMSDALIFDAAASAYLECRANDFEASLPFENLGFRFCPGYGGTSLQDNRIIAEQLQASQIGITFLDSNLMVPMKSMLGIVRLGGRSEKNCARCTARENCAYRKNGTRCY